MMKKIPTTVFIIAVLTLLLVPSSSALKVESNKQVFSKRIENSSAPSLDQQDTVSSDQLIIETLDLLISIKNETGSWELPSMSNDQRTYYGLAGGMAGIGMKLLDAMEFDVIKADIVLSGKILAVAEEIGIDLMSAGMINATYAVWNVTDSDDIVDLGWDFGLAGISAYYSSLYNNSENTIYREVALKTLQTIQDTANYTNGLHWESQLYSFIDGLDWYDPQDINYIGLYDQSKMVFSGISLGTTGVAKSALAYITNTNDQANLVANTVLNSSLTYLESIAIVNGSQRSFLVAEAFSGFKFTNIANGVSGIARFYADLFVHTNNSTYGEYSLEIVNWLNGTATRFNASQTFRFKLVYEVGDILLSDRELGYTHGVAGVISTLFNIGLLLNNDTALAMSKQLADELYKSRIDTGEFLIIPDWSVSGNFNPDITTSWAFGMSGTFVVLFEIADYYGQDTNKERLSEMKNYLLSQVIKLNGKNGIKTTYSNQIEINPSVGLPGFIEMLSLATKARLNVGMHSLDFGSVEIGSSKTLSLFVENVGEQDLVVTWNQSIATDIFSSDSSGITISPRKSYVLNLTFSPSEERLYPLEENAWIVTGDNTEFDVALTGIGFDIPVISLTSSAVNNSLFDSHGDIDFSLTITDSSPIKSVTINLDTTVDTLTFDQSSNSYITTIITNPLTNGTYNLVFSATDEGDNTGQVTFVFQVGVYTSNIIDKAVSDTSRNILIGAIVVVLAVAIIITKFYMRSSD